MELDDAYIYDWNEHQGKRKLPSSIMLDDESLRDGLQSPSVADPPTEGKLQLVRLMEKLGIDAVDIGFPRASRKMYNDVKAISEMIRDENINIFPNRL